MLNCFRNHWDTCRLPGRILAPLCGLKEVTWLFGACLYNGDNNISTYEIGIRIKYVNRCNAYMYLGQCSAHSKQLYMYLLSFSFLFIFHLFMQSSDKYDWFDHS